MSDLEPELVRIPAGKVVLGLPACPPEAKFHHRWHSGKTVSVAAFKLGRFAVTNDEYRRYMRASGAPAPSHIDQPGFNGQRQPVGGISWDDAHAYCQWLAKVSGKRYRLPTDEEWEYAARGGHEGRCFPWGDCVDATHACYGGVAAPRPVGSYPPNDFGLFDMIGNMWQWCADRFEDKSEGLKAVNKPTGKDPSVNRVLRGGSYLTTNVLNLWIAYRHEDPPDLRHECLGFRVACDE